MVGPTRFFVLLDLGGPTVPVIIHALAAANGEHTEESHGHAIPPGIKNTP